MRTSAAAPAAPVAETSTDLSLRVEDLHRELEAGQRQLLDLQSDFGKETDPVRIGALQQKVFSKSQHLEGLASAIEGLTRRGDDLRRQEEHALAEQKSREANEHLTAKTRQFVELHKLLLPLQELLDRMTATNAAIESSNSLAMQLGREDLVVRTLLARVAANKDHLRAKRGEDGLVDLTKTVIRGLERHGLAPDAMRRGFKQANGRMSQARKV